MNHRPLCYGLSRAVAHSFRRKVWTLIVKSHCGELWNAIDHQLRASFGLAVAYQLWNHTLNHLCYIEASCLKEILKLSLDLKVYWILWCIESKDILSMKNEIGVLMNHYTTFNFMINFHLNYLEFASPGKWNWSPYTSNYNFQLVIQSTRNEIESYKNAVKSHLSRSKFFTRLLLVIVHFTSSSSSQQHVQSEQQHSNTR